MYRSIVIDPLFLSSAVSSIISHSKLFHIHLYSLFIYNKFVDISYRSNEKSVTDVKKNIIVLHDKGISQQEISRRSKILHRCIRQTASKFHTVTTRSVAGRPPKVTYREKRLIKLQQLRDDTVSSADLVRYVNTNLNLSIGRSTISCILQDYNIASYIAPRQLRITPTQRRNRLKWCYDYLSWSINHWSNVIFSYERNLEVLNRKDRIYISSIP